MTVLHPNDNEHHAETCRYRQTPGCASWALCDCGVYAAWAAVQMTACPSPDPCSDTGGLHQGIMETIAAEVTAKNQLLMTALVHVRDMAAPHAVIHPATFGAIERVAHTALVFTLCDKPSARQTFERVADALVQAEKHLQAHVPAQVRFEVERAKVLMNALAGRA